MAGVMPMHLEVKGKETRAVASTALCELTRFAQGLHPSAISFCVHRVGGREGRAHLYHLGEGGDLCLQLVDPPQCNYQRCTSRAKVENSSTHHEELHMS